MLKRENKQKKDTHFSFIILISTLAFLLIWNDSELPYAVLNKLPLFIVPSISI